MDYRLNRDSIIDLALTEFLLDAMGEASRVLGVDGERRAAWREVRENLAAYPKGKGPFGEVWLDVVDAPREWIYNVPVTLAPVFPCEQVGLGLRPEMREIAERTIRTVRLEGGNDLVWQPMARARMGLLDVKWFLREVRYCRTTLGVANDRVRQAGGRYRDETNYDFMMRMGVWTENLSLPAVVNECLLQSYSGTLRVFPNRKGLGAARFRDLRAAGALLVSAGWDGKTVSPVRIRSEKGARVRLSNPWPGAQAEVAMAPGGRAVEHAGDRETIEFATKAGETYEVRPRRAERAAAGRSRGADAALQLAYPPFLCQDR